ncbi:hypothetical protein F8M41_003068 [Gigaspora margarita]|uniref:Uncharacterized protein n=1 Tax=Gigaspora margarita TaxID=4874 RepID=A0A8H4A6I9_GIGMA|nr:hypothetical protein F8M41_003068 [Gigaspora margarita]
MLPRTEWLKILHSEPHNAEIEYQPPQMEQYFLCAMSKQQREFDKIIRNISYRTSAILRPIDNIEKILYNSNPDDSDPEAKAGYELLQSNYNARELLCDTLLYANDYRREVALKAISPARTSSRDEKGVFGNKIKDMVEEENTKSKLYNDRATNIPGIYTNTSRLL